LNAAMEVRGLTSGALLGSMLVAVFWRRLGPRAVVAGMAAALIVMNSLYWPPRLETTKVWWKQTFGGDVYWPWFTLIGTVVMLSVTYLVYLILPKSLVKQEPEPVTARN